MGKSINRNKKDWLKLEVLLIIFGILLVMAILLQFLLYSSRYGKNKIVYLGNVILAIIVAAMSYTSFPENYSVARFIALILGLLSLLGLVLRYKDEKEETMSKILVSISLILGIIYLFFGI